MPARRLPRTHAAIIRSLTAARAAWKQHPTDRLIPTEHWAQLDDADPGSLLNLLLARHSLISQALAAQGTATTAHRESITTLRTVTSHFHQVLDLAIERGVFTPSDRAYYHRPVETAGLPPLTTDAEILLAASRILPGEQKRLAKNPGTALALAFPSAAEVAAAHTAAVAAHRLAEEKKHATGTARSRTAELIPAARALAVSIIRHIDFRLSERPGLDAPSRRRIAKAWGVRYEKETAAGS